MRKLCVAFVATLLFCTLAEASKVESVAPNPLYKTTTITEAGYYKLEQNVVGTITIATNDVTFDLNDYYLTGSTHGVVINNNAQRVTVRNGTITAPATGNGIEIAGGCSNIRVSGIRADQCAIGLNASTATTLNISKSSFLSNTNEGIKLTSCSRCSLFDCKVSGNQTGILLEQCTNSQVQACLSTNNSYAGYWLDSCNRNIFWQCKSIYVGNESSNDSFGFLAENGSCNTFEQCFSKGTTTISTATSIVAAAYGIKGTESCSSIHKCQASYTSVPAEGASTAYGIWLEEQYSSPSQLAAGDRGADAFSAQWHPKICGLFAVAGDRYSGSNKKYAQLSTYLFDSNDNSIRPLQSVTHDTRSSTNDIKTIDWSKDGHYLAIAGERGSGRYDMRVYKVDSCSYMLNLVANANHNSSSSYSLNAISWSPSGWHLVVGGNRSSRSLGLYRFDKNDETLTSTYRISHGATVYAADWHPTENFVAIGSDTASGKQVFVYEFNPRDEDLSDTVTVNTQHGDTVRAVSWSSDGKYLAVVGDRTSNLTTRLYEFDSSTKTLTLRDSQDHGNTCYSVCWSPDDRYIVTGGIGVSGNEVRIYTCDHATKTLSLQDSADTISDPAYAVSWSPNGEQLLFAGDRDSSTTHTIFSAYTFPQKNIITSNTVYCVTGNSYGWNTGISGSSCSNLMASNVSYRNENRDYLFVLDVPNTTCLDQSGAGIQAACTCVCEGSGD